MNRERKRFLTVISGFVLSALYQKLAGDVDVTLALLMGFVVAWIMDGSQ